MNILQNVHGGAVRLRYISGQVRDPLPPLDGILCLAHGGTGGARLRSLRGPHPSLPPQPILFLRGGTNFFYNRMLQYQHVVTCIALRTAVNYAARPWGPRRQ